MKPKFIEHITLNHQKFLTPLIDGVEGGELSTTLNVLIKPVNSIDDAIHNGVTDIATEAGIDDIYLLDKKNIVSALERQIPKKPCIPFDSIYQEYECPVCPHKVDKTQLYCDKCGQALDWSDTE